MLPSPELFGHTLSWYGLFHKLALLTAGVFFLLRFRSLRSLQLKPMTLLALFFAIVVTGYAGARLFSLLDYVTSGGSWNAITAEWIFTGQGLRWYGSILCFLLLLPALTRWFGPQAIGPVFDQIALALCLFTAVVKLACLFSGDGCYGVATTLPWPFGMYFPYGQEPNILPAHPTPLYDSLFHLGLFVYLLRFSRKQPVPGRTALLFFLCTSAFNIALEYIRRNPDVAFGLTLAQWTYLFVFALALLQYQPFKNPPVPPRSSDKNPKYTSTRISLKTTR